MTQYDNFQGAGSGSGSGSGSMSQSSQAVHDDALHTGSAKRNAASGVAANNASGVPQDTSGNAAELQSKKNTANGYPGLNASSKIATSQLDTGTGANQIVQLDATGKMPAVPGTNLTGVLTYASVYGDGSDGAATISSNTNLTKDMQYTNLTINTGITLSTKGFCIFVSGTLTLNGTIDNSGASNVGAAAGTLGGGVNGSGVNTAGVGGAGYGGNGGAAWGAGGVIAKRVVLNATFLNVIEGATANHLGGGGGSGESNGSAGTGGGGGGVIFLAANTITGTGNIFAKGGNSTTAGAGGGGGGAIFLIYNTKTAITQSVAGGTGQNAGATGNLYSMVV